MSASPSSAGYYIGMMSGTSMDGVDAVLASADEDGRLRTRALISLDIDASLRADLMALQQTGPDEMVRANVAANALTRHYADAVRQLLEQARREADLRDLTIADIIAIGAHGQTVRHRPELGFTVQLLNGALLAQLTGISVVNDLRSADIAVGGQGAPLAPVYHAAVFGHASARRVVANIGGIGNVSLLAPGQPVIGYDTGPGNVLLDAWIERHMQQRYDQDGRWGASAPADAALLRTLQAEPYFLLPAPKSTGRDLFGAAWLDRGLARHQATQATVPAAAVVQSTLIDLTVWSITRACQEFSAEEVYVCGGGARNGELMRRLALSLPGVTVADTSALGVDPQSVEALAFAWLARQRIAGLPGNLPSVTGAHRAVVLGALHSAA